MNEQQFAIYIEKVDVTNNLLAINNALLYIFLVLGGILLISKFVYHILKKFI